MSYTSFGRRETRDARGWLFPGPASRSGPYSLISVPGPGFQLCMCSILRSMEYCKCGVTFQVGGLLIPQVLQTRHWISRKRWVWYGGVVKQTVTPYPHTPLGTTQHRTGSIPPYPSDSHLPNSETRGTAPATRPHEPRSRAAALTVWSICAAGTAEPKVAGVVSSS